MAKTFPPQEQRSQPGVQTAMQPQPVVIRPGYRGSEKLRDRVAIITGGDSGIGRSAAVHFAAEGARVAIVYLNEKRDADDTLRMVREHGSAGIAIQGDVGDEAFCRQVVEQVIREFGRLDIVVNNAAEQHPQESIADISADQLDRTFRTNIFAMFYLVKAALPHLKDGAAIINTTSITAYAGSPKLLDYSTTKGAIVAYTRSLSQALVEQGIRVNAVAPGPIWTPLIPSTFPADKVEQFGSDTPMKRAGQPAELGPAYVYLASDDSSYMAGQVLHLNGGEIVNG